MRVSSREFAVRRSRNRQEKGNDIFRACLKSSMAPRGRTSFSDSPQTILHSMPHLGALKAPNGPLWTPPRIISRQKSSIHRIRRRRTGRNFALTAIRTSCRSHSGQSLVLIAERTPGEAVRYRLLEPIRQYALEALRGAEAEATTRDRHLNYFVQFTEQAEPKLKGEDQLVWLKPSASVCECALAYWSRCASLSVYSTL